MGMAEGYRRIGETQKADWVAFEQRCQKFGIIPDPRDFNGDRPQTRNAWGTLETLLKAEERLDKQEQEKIAEALERLSIHERADEIRERLSKGVDLPDPEWPDSSPSIPAKLALSPKADSVVLWTAVRELGLDRGDKYDGYRKQAQLQMYQIAKERGDF